MTLTISTAKLTPSIAQGIASALENIAKKVNSNSNYFYISNMQQETDMTATQIQYESAITALAETRNSTADLKKRLIRLPLTNPLTFLINWLSFSILIHRISRVEKALSKHAEITVPTNIVYQSKRDFLQLLDRNGYSTFAKKEELAEYLRQNSSQFQTKELFKLTDSTEIAAFNQLIIEHLKTQFDVIGFPLIEASFAFSNERFTLQDYLDLTLLQQPAPANLEEL